MSDRWKQIDQLVDEQKLQAALVLAVEIQAEAEAGDDTSNHTRALIRRVQLETALSGFQKAVDLLRSEPWPEDSRSRAALELVYATSLTTYEQQYAWEVRQRERVVADDVVDLEKWTSQQIRAEANRAFERLWAKREAWGDRGLGELTEFVRPGTWPAGIRSTLRDTVAYLWVEMMADTGSWTAAQQQVWRLDLEALLAGVPAGGGGDASAHPLERIAAVLGDLEGWHQAQQRPEAALEAFLERIRRLQESFQGRPDRERITMALRERVEATPRQLPWWSMAVAELAEAVRAQEGADALVQARRLAEDGRRAHPQSPGGARCAFIVAGIEAPQYALQMMQSDALAKPSILLQHANLERVYFRAVRLDPEQRLATADDWSWLPRWDEAEKLLRDRKPEVRWSVDLSATPDYRSHRTLVEPEIPRAGLWLIGASARDDFRDGSNQIVAQAAMFGDPVLLVSRQQDEHTWTVTVRSGSTGALIEGAEVSLVRLDWRNGHRVVRTERTTASGSVQFDASSWDHQHLVYAKVGAELAVDFQQLHRVWVQGQGSDVGTLLYTDRAAYRPGQRVLWKAVAWQRDAAAGTVAVSPQTSLRIALQDANGEEVESIDVTTNTHGSASGSFLAPPGRLLGRWTLVSSRTGSATIRVEEYKRPTFEVTLEPPAAALRLNRPAELAGEARYAFGLPVSSGSVRYRVSREEVRPWWWWWAPPTAGGAEIVASGETELGSDGRFVVRFEPAADEQRAGEKGLSWRFRIDTDVTDAGGETRSATRSVRLGFVAVEATVTSSGDFLAADEAGTLDVRRVDLDGSPRQGAGSWALHRLVAPATTVEPTAVPRGSLGGDAGPDQFQTPGDRQRARWEGEIRPEVVLSTWESGHLVARGQVDHGQDGVATVALPPLEPGTYRLRYTTTDAFGSVFELDRDLIVAGRKPERLPLPLVLGLSASSVEVGNVAEVLVHSGFAGLPLRLEVFRSGVRERVEDIVAAGSPKLIELPVTKRERGGVSLRLSALRDHQLMVVERHLAVPWTDRQLEVSFATFRDRLEPRAKERWTVQVRDPGGAELQSAELLASMFDRTLDAIAPYAPPRPLGLFPSRFGTGLLRGSLGLAPTLWSGGHGLANLPSYPTFDAGGVIVFDRYGIGGPGFRGQVRFRGGVQAIAESMAMPAAAPAPANEQALFQKVVAADEADASAEGQEARQGTESASSTSAEVEVREDFSETALWQPHLTLDAGGTVGLEVSMPDSVTEWSVWVHALTADFRSGSVEQRVRTVKELQVRPSLPRFLREGDHLRIEILVDNASDEAFDAEVRFDLEDPETGASLAQAFAIDREAVSGRRVAIEPGRTATLPVELVVPNRLGPVAVRVTARAGERSDGELRPLPVLPGRMHLSQSRFATLRDAARRTLRFDDLVAGDDPTLLTEQLVVTVDAQLLTSVLRALPYLVEYPYECTEQTLNRFLSTGIITSVFDDHPALAALGARLAADRDTVWERFDGDDPNRRMELEETPWLRESRGGDTGDLRLLHVLDPDVAASQRRDALAKLEKAQTSSGGFPWFPGGPPSPWITLYLVDGFSRALEFGVEVPKPMVVSAWRYLHRWYLDELVREAMAQDCCWESVSYLGYVLSAYPDESWTGGVFTADERRTMLDFSWKHWRQHSPRLKAYLALTLHRAGRQADARLVLDSILDSATTDEDLGTYWAREDKSWLWYQDTVESHAFILRAVSELDPDDPRRDGLIQWLFLEKKLGHWKSTRATAEAIYALTWALDRDGRIGVREVVEVAAGPEHAEFVFEPSDPQTRAQLIIPGERVTPATGSVEVRKDTPGFAFATATWHFSTEKLPEKADGDLFGVERRYFVRRLQGQELVLEPLVAGSRVEPGDEIEVQLEIRARHAAEYVHLRDPRPAGFEPQGFTSGWKWDLGLAWYEEIRDSGTNFFFERLPTGAYTLKHRLAVRQAGVFKVAPATLQSIYAPEFTAHSAGDVLVVGGRPR